MNNKELLSKLLKEYKKNQSKYLEHKKEVTSAEKFEMIVNSVSSIYGMNYKAIAKYLGITYAQLCNLKKKDGLKAEAIIGYIEKLSQLKGYNKDIK